MNNPTENRTYSAEEFAHSRGGMTEGEAESIRRSARRWARGTERTFPSLLWAIEAELETLRTRETRGQLEDIRSLGDVIFSAQLIRTLATFLIKRAEFHAIPKTLADLYKPRRVHSARPLSQQEPSTGDAA